MSARDHALASPLARPHTMHLWFNLASIAAITGFAVLWQTRWGTVPDTSWLITICERLLAGERLYVDLAETNPPFSTWLYVPPVALAGRLGIAPEILVHAWTYLAALVGVGFAGWIARRADFDETQGLVRWSPAIYALLVLFPGNAFSQREHIGVCLFLPMLVMMAWRMRRGPPRPDAAISILAGLCGSVLILVKPYYAGMVLVPTLATCWRKRSLRPLFVAEHWVIGAVCVAYLITVQLTHPEFLRDVYPRLADAYVSVRSYLPMLQMYGPTALFLGIATFLFWPNERAAPELAVTALLCSMAGLAALVWQAKGWAYHAYPALVFALFALIVLSCLPTTARSGWRAGQAMRPIRQATLAIAALAAFLPLWVTQKPSDEIVATIAEAVDRPAVVSISIDIATGHPLTRMAGGHYRLSHPNLWLVRSAERLIGQVSDDPDEIARLTAMRDGFLAGAVTEIERIAPDIILDSVGQTSAWRTIHADEGMQRVLADYDVIYQDKTLSVLIRSDLRSDKPATNGG